MPHSSTVLHRVNSPAPTQPVTRGPRRARESNPTRYPKPGMEPPSTPRAPSVGLEEPNWHLKFPRRQPPGHRIGFQPEPATRNSQLVTAAESPLVSRFSYRASRVLDCPRVKQPRPRSARGACQPFARMKLVATGSSRSGNGTPALIPACLHFRNQAMFLPNTRMTCSPSRSLFTSSGLEP